MLSSVEAEVKTGKSGFVCCGGKNKLKLYANSSIVHADDVRLIKVGKVIINCSSLTGALPTLIVADSLH